MNLKEIEYIVKISEERNVTRAAEKLFITPSALNQQLLHLERISARLCSTAPAPAGPLQKPGKSIWRPQRRCCA